MKPGYDKNNNLIPGGKGVINGLLQPGEVANHRDPDARQPEHVDEHAAVQPCQRHGEDASREIARRAKGSGSQAGDCGQEMDVRASRTSQFLCRRGTTTEVKRRGEDLRRDGAAGWRALAILDYQVAVGRSISDDLRCEAGRGPRAQERRRPSRSKNQPPAADGWPHAPAITRSTRL